MLYGAYRLLRLGPLVDSRGQGAEPEAPLPIGVLAMFQNRVVADRAEP